MKVEEKLTNKEKRAVIIRKYQQYLKLEKALSPNTLDAYMTDLQKLLHFLEGENIEIPDVTPDDLQRFAAGLHDIGIHPRSQARILSGIKSFFHFLVIADYQEADPSELLEGPKIGFRLPEVLTVEEIDRIISTVDMEKKEGQRNRAILETLYSCGLRVSELCNLENLRPLFRGRVHQGGRQRRQTAFSTYLASCNQGDKVLVCRPQPGKNKERIRGLRISGTMGQ